MNHIIYMEHIIYITNFFINILNVNFANVNKNNILYLYTNFYTQKKHKVASI